MAARMVVAVMEELVAAEESTGKCKASKAGAEAQQVATEVNPLAHIASRTIRSGSGRFPHLLSSSRCRRTNRFLGLILEALIRKGNSTLERCCNEMKEGADQAPLKAFRRLRQLAQALEQS